jgi:hypothetical protein
MKTERSAKFKCPQCPKTFAAKTGLGSHLRTHGIAGQSKTAVASRAKLGVQRPLETAPPPEAPPTAAAGSPSGPPYLCPECKDPFNSPAQLGRHRRFKHGVVGRFAQQAIDAATAALAPRKRGRPRKSVVDNQSTQLQPVERVPQNHEQRHVNSNGHEASPAALDPIAYALTIGSIKEFCRRAAEEHGIPTREFTRQCAELFLREARR